MAAQGLAARAAAFGQALGHGREPAAMFAGALDLALDSVEGASVVSVSFIIDGTPQTTASSDEARSLAVDAAQYEADRGPCLDAARRGQVVDLADVTAVEAAGAYPEFAQAAVASGVASSLSIPMDDGADLVGSLNFYSTEPNRIGPDAREIAEVFGVVAAISLRGATGYVSASVQAEQLRVALQSRDLIGQAKGILMASRKIGPDEAFALAPAGLPAPEHQAPGRGAARGRYG